MDVDIYHDMPSSPDIEISSKKRNRTSFGEDINEGDNKRSKTAENVCNHEFNFQDPSSSHLKASSKFDKSYNLLSIDETDSLGYYIRPPRNSQYVHITLKNRLLYATIDSESEESATRQNKLKFQGNLLGISIDDIKKQVDEEMRRELWEQSKKKESKEAVNSAAATKLWVDKYAPSNFNELLSDEKINRNVLVWIKEWSGCAFGQNFINPFSPNKTKNFSESNTDRIKESKDRPDVRCILLSGPPGIGKTTLAHVLLKAAGFEPYEFNASDDRTASKFMPRVMDVVGTESKFGSGKPKALIIDEIDGVSGSEGSSAIESLVKLLDENGPSSTSSEDNNDSGNTASGGSRGANRKAKPFKLKRPIICICNDLWAPSLRPLRERALVFKLDPPTMQNLLSRLEFVCVKEGVLIQKPVLQAICEIANFDIRSSLNTLQFLSRKSSHITAELLADSSFGNKDLTSNIFSVWNNIFAKNEEKTSILQRLLDVSNRSQPKSKTRQFNGRNFFKTLHSGNSFASSSTAIERISAIVKASDTSKVIDGLYENYPMVKYHDPMMETTSSLLNWMELYDDLTTSIFSKQFFALNAYVPYVASAFHLFCSTPTPTHQVSFPRQEFQARQLHSTHITTLNALLSGLQPKIRPYLDFTRTTVDLVSFLVKIITPNVRPVNVQMLSPIEKIKLRQLIGVCLSYGLTFIESSVFTDYPEDEERLQAWAKRHHSQRIANPHLNPAVELTQHQWMLTPPIHRVTHFRIPVGFRFVEANSTDFDNTSDVSRQMVSAQIIQDRQQKRESSVAHMATEIVTKASEERSKTKQRMQEEVEVVHKDFFGRIIAVPSHTISKSSVGVSSGNTMTALNSEQSVKFFYKYHEGKTDAVRRKVFIKDLL